MIPIRRKSQISTTSSRARKLHFPLWLIFALVIDSFKCCCFAETGFKVTGELSFWKSTTTNTYELHETCRFEASVLGSSWQQTTRLNSGQCITHGSDGRDVYWLLLDPAGKQKQNLTAYPGNVFNGCYPVQSASVWNTLPWLAYCSESYFTQQASNIIDDSLLLPAPWQQASGLVLAHIYRATVCWLSDYPKLPARVAYRPDPLAMEAIRNGIFRTTSVPDKSERDRAILQLASYYSRVKEPEAVYTVTSFTNWHGLVLPLEFSLDRFFFPKSTNLTRRPFGSTRGRITHLEEIATLDPYPRLDGDLTHIRVADYRFFNPAENVGFIAYTATNSAWVTNESDPFLRRLYEGEKSRSRAFLARRVFSRSLVLLFFLVALACPLLSKAVRAAGVRLLRAAGGYR